MNTACFTAPWPLVGEPVRSGDAHTLSGQCLGHWLPLLSTKSNDAGADGGGGGRSPAFVSLDLNAGLGSVPSSYPPGRMLLLEDF